MDFFIENPNCSPMPFIRYDAENRENKVSRGLDDIDKRLVNK